MDYNSIAIAACGSHVTAGPFWPAAYMCLQHFVCPQTVDQILNYLRVNLGKDVLKLAQWNRAICEEWRNRRPAA